MSSLRERLARFDSSLRARPATARAVASTRPLEELGFVWMTGGVLRREFEVRDVPSTERVGAALWKLGARTPRPPSLPWIVLDTETTGLESGTGTLVFLVGWVEWSEAGTRVVQLFMPEPASEASLLAAVAARLESAGAIVSYNGKSFDLPRLRSRATLQRSSLDDRGLPHLDLLHPCRRLTRGWLEDTRLATVERALLGLERDDDLPGAEVPEAYRAFLRGEIDAPLDRVVEHNALDVVRLTHLAVALSRLLDGEDATLPAPSRLALARWLAAADGVESARSRLEPLSAEQGWVGREALWLLAQLERRAREFESARARLVDLTRRAPNWLEPRIALAKLQEHRLGDLPGARRTVLAALDLQRRGADLGQPVSTRQLRELRHRLSRIERKGSMP